MGRTIINTKKKDSNIIRTIRRKTNVQDVRHYMKKLKQTYHGEWTRNLIERQTQTGKAEIGGGAIAAFLTSTCTEQGKLEASGKCLCGRKLNKMNNVKQKIVY